jgi:hypothetical protein
MKIRFYKYISRLLSFFIFRKKYKKLTYYNKKKEWTNFGKNF